MIAIIDYGVGNIFSIRSSLDYIGAETAVTSDPEEIRAADRILLPGVGAFEDAARKLRETGLSEILRDEAASGKPFMGICLGMQLLFERSFEYGEHSGLGLIKGDIVSMEGRVGDLKIPQIGWNDLKLTDRDDPILKYVKDGDYVYFVHGYFAPAGEYTTSTVNYGCDITATVRSGNICGCQFHPEKSGSVGLGILKGFCGM